MGFNNEGLVPAVARLVRRPEGWLSGATLARADHNDRAVEDLACVDAMHAHVDYFVVREFSQHTWRGIARPAAHGMLRAVVRGNMTILRHQYS